MQTQQPASSVDAPVGGSPSPRTEDGTVLAEYGLTLVVVGSIAAVALRFVNSGSILSLLTDVLDQARALVGL